LNVKSWKQENRTTSESSPNKARQSLTWPVDRSVLLAVKAAQTEVYAT